MCCCKSGGAVGERRTVTANRHHASGLLSPSKACLDFDYWLPTSPAHYNASILGGQLLEPRHVSPSAHFVLVDEPQRHADHFRGQRLQLQVSRPDHVLDECGLAVADVHTMTI